MYTSSTCKGNHLDKFTQYCDEVQIGTEGCAFLEGESLLADVEVVVKTNEKWARPTRHFQSLVL